jgi:hypothetical protein
VYLSPEAGETTEKIYRGKREEGGKREGRGREEGGKREGRGGRREREGGN